MMGLEQAFTILLKQRGVVIDESKVIVNFCEGFIELRDAKGVAENEKQFGADGKKVYNPNFACEFLITNQLVKRQTSM